jgi:signal transduction histidine kinase
LVIRVGLSHVPPAHTVLAPAPAVTYLTIAVRDFGSGIPTEVLPRVFEPFFTTKSLSQKRGTGLGLSMVYRTAVENGFGLAVETALNEGTTFTIAVPQPAAPEPESPAPSHP